MTASGRSLGGLYGPWEATIVSDGSQDGVKLTTQLALRFTTVKDGEGAAVGTLAFRGTGNVFPIASDLTMDTPVSGTVRISGNKNHRRLCLKLRADQVSGRGRASDLLSGGGEICIELPVSGGGGFEWEEQFLAVDGEGRTGARSRRVRVAGEPRVSGCWPAAPRS